MLRKIRHFGIRELMVYVLIANSARALPLCLLHWYQQGDNKLDSVFLRLRGRQTAKALWPTERQIYNYFPREELNGNTDPQDSQNL